MASRTAQIAEALKTDAESHGWPVTVSAHREYLKPIRRADLGAVKRVSVFPYSLAVSNASRGAVGQERGVALVLRAAAEPSDTSEIDALIETVEAMADRYLKTEIGGSAPASVAMILGDEIYDVDRLGQELLFQGGIVITYNTRT